MLQPLQSQAPRTKTTFYADKMLALSHALRALYMHPARLAHLASVFQRKWNAVRQNLQIKVLVLSAIYLLQRFKPFPLTEMLRVSSSISTHSFQGQPDFRKRSNVIGPYYEYRRSNCRRWINYLTRHSHPNCRRYWNRSLWY